MTLVSLERRLRALETRRSGGVAIYLAWGRTHAEAEHALRAARNSGTVSSRDKAVALVWPDTDPAPTSRWIALGRKHEASLTDREVEILHDTLEAEAVDRERADLVAAGEDVSGLDDTDLCIRVARRQVGDVTGSLRMIATRENPSPKVHWQPCDCDRCLEGETHPMEGHRRYHARFKAWLDRYVPGEGLFA